MNVRHGNGIFHDSGKRGGVHQLFDRAIEEGGFEQSFISVESRRNAHPRMESGWNSHTFRSILRRSLFLTCCIAVLWSTTTSNPLLVSCMLCRETLLVLSAASFADLTCLAASPSSAEPKSPKSLHRYRFRFGQVEYFVEPVYEQGLTIEALNLHFAGQIRSLHVSLTLQPQQSFGSVNKEFPQIGSSNTKRPICSVLGFVDSRRSACGHQTPI